MKANRNFFFLMMLLFSCGPKPARQELRVGINGEAVYTLEEDGSVNGLFKREYSVNDYTILIQRDTVSIGEEFYSLFMIASPNHSIKINSPEEKEIFNEKNGAPASYTFRPLRTGTYDFSGTVKYDSVTVPFSYRFLVVDSNE